MWKGDFMRQNSKKLLSDPSKPDSVPEFFPDRLSAEIKASTKADRPKGSDRPSKKYVALIAHSNMVPALKQFVEKHAKVLTKYTLCGPRELIDGISSSLGARAVM